MKITERIDKRVEHLISLRKDYLTQGDQEFATQMWARINELKLLKEKYVDNEGEWLV